MNKDLRIKINRGELDVNNMTSFISIVMKGLLHNLNNKISVRGNYIPHFILNTGDDIMYLENKGQDHSIEPHEVSNEAFVYTTVPRCNVDMGGIDIPTDQLTNPYTRGNLIVEDEGEMTAFTAEYRRMPMKITVSLKYRLDSFQDMLETTQQIITKMMFIQIFNVSYMGQNIECSYKVPESVSHEKNIEFDGGTTDIKDRIISLDLEVETNMPIYDCKTAIESDLLISGGKSVLIVTDDHDVKHATKERIELNID